MKLPNVFIALALAALPVAAHANSAHDAIEKRKAVFQEFKKVFGQQMGDVMKGKAPYEPKQFAALAKEMEKLSKQPWAYFPANSQQGDTDALPTVWSDAAKFKAEIQVHEKAAAQLAKTASTAQELAAIRPAFGALQKTCKSCHDSFKK